MNYTILIFLAICFGTCVSAGGDVYKIQLLKDTESTRDCNFAEFLSVKNESCTTAGPFWTTENDSTEWKLAKVEGQFAIKIKPYPKSLKCTGWMNAASTTCTPSTIGFGPLSPDDLSTWSLNLVTEDVIDRPNEYSLINRALDGICSKAVIGANKDCSKKKAGLKGMGGYANSRVKVLLQGGTSETMTPKITLDGNVGDIKSFTITPPTFGTLPISYYVCLRPSCANPPCAGLVWCMDVAADGSNPVSDKLEAMLPCNVGYQLKVAGLRPIGTWTPVGSANSVIATVCSGR